MFSTMSSSSLNIGSQTIEFPLHFDYQWDKLKQQDAETITGDNVKHFLIYQDKTYTVQRRAIMVSEKLSKVLSLDSTGRSFALDLKYRVEGASFDYFLQMLYGNPNVKVPQRLASDIITICIELGKLIWIDDDN